MNKLIRYFKLIKERKEWRLCNSHNHTYMKNLFRRENVEVGKATYGGIYVLNDVSNVKLKIGSFCSIAEEVVFLLGADHKINSISTYPFDYYFSKNLKLQAISKGDIIIGDDVWIGQRSTIMSGIMVGQGAVIAAGSLVTKNVPPYAIVGGVPAKIIKYRFDSKMINELLKIDYSKLTMSEIEVHLPNLRSDLINIEQIDWLPKK
mgnify:CR=1 FL=1